MQAAYLLQVRPYRDTSLLLEAFTLAFGRFSLVARGVRGVRSRSQRVRFGGTLQPFTPLFLSWSGQQELRTLTASEAMGSASMLSGAALFCGLYFNELLVRLLPRFDAYPALFHVYRESLEALPKLGFRSVHRFEKILLAELGFALRLDREAGSGYPICASRYYAFDPSRGFSCCSSHLQAYPHVFQGRALLALHGDQLEETTVQRDVRRLLSLALDYLLEGRPLYSRALLALY